MESMQMCSKLLRTVCAYVSVADTWSQKTFTCGSSKSKCAFYCQNEQDSLKTQGAQTDY